MAGLFEYDRREQSLDKESSMYGRGLGFQVYVNSEEPAKVNADAVTKGSSIFLSQGREDLLRHELGHVIQQKKGIVPATGYVAGQPLNDNAALEQEAGRLGSRIPQWTVDRALYNSRQGMYLKGVQGVMQCCGGRKRADAIQAQKEAAIQRMAQELKGLGSELANIKSDNGMKPQKKQKALKAVQDLFDTKRDELRVLLYELYGRDQETLVNNLVDNIGNGRYVAIGADLRGHLFRGLLVTAPPKKKAGKSNDSTPLPQTTTGLHAYTDSEDGSETGKYPPGIVPLGIIGDPAGVHILHWRAEASPKSKFSTMLPAGLHEGLSKLLFEVALGGSAGSTFAGITMGKSGDTVYPDGNEVEMPEVTRGMAFGETGKNAGRVVTLGDIFIAYDPEKEKEEAALREALPRLIEAHIYVPEERFDEF